ncbi:MAG TPA: glycosyltransferase, partial [Acidimicrobiales bacterium]|nr:glycosyltransferase [Acidimicrobiales bacterium]
MSPPNGTLRVLHVTSSFPRRAGDHQAPYLADLVAAQRRAGLSPAVLAPHGPGLASDEVIDGVPVHRFRYAPVRGEVLAYRGGLLRTATTPAGALSLPGFIAAFAAATARATRRHRADVVHAHWWLPAGLAALAAQAATRVPYVVTAHGSDVHLAARPGLAGLARTVWRRAAGLAAVSEAMAAEVGRLAPGLNVEVARMPVPEPSLPPVDQPPAPPVRLVAAGRFMPEKGLDVAIDAVTRLVARGTEVRLLIMGDGPLARDLTLLAGAAHGAVDVVGPGSRQGLWDAIDASHALVVPSRREGLGLIALDAFLRGRPVIASAVGGLTETVGAADGALVPPDDPA